MIRTFISFSHREHCKEKEEIARIIDSCEGMQDESVGWNEIDDNLAPQTIRKTIRDKYLRETNVTIVLAGHNAKYRKHIDWEIYSSMLDGEKNKKSGILVIDMTNNEIFRICSVYEKIKIHSPNSEWFEWSDSETRNKCDHMPKRIVENLIEDGAKILVVPWSKIKNNKPLLIDAIKLVHQHRESSNFKLDDPMRKNDNNSNLVESPKCV